ncbi:MAG: hypothetical protein H7Z37_18780 [Pyrinomonadaceae bacterium]|nr:hypothetical protein [Pyrinomonadaceae bacterium]
MKKTLLICGIICAVSSLSNCGNATPDTAKSSSSNANINLVVNTNRPEPPKNPITPFENDLFDVRIAEVDQVLVFRRKDENALTSEDKKFLRENSPNETGYSVNRWVVDKGDKFAIAGTNFYFKPEQIAALQQRFDVKDFSKGDGVEINVSEYSASERERIENLRNAKKKKQAK